jgi:hypothetical protein
MIVFGHIDGIVVNNYFVVLRELVMLPSLAADAS